MFCRQCGNEIKEGTAFCSNCGCAVAASAPGAAPEAEVSGGSKGKKQKKQKEMNQKGKKKKGLLVFVLLALVLAGGVGAGAFWYLNSESHLIAKNMKLAQECFAEEEYEQAVEYYQEALKLDKGLAEAYLGAADTFIADDNYEEAIDILKKGIKRVDEGKDAEEELKDKLVEAYCLGADYYADSGERQRAYELLEAGAEELEAPELADKLAELDGRSAPEEAEAREEQTEKETDDDDKSNVPESSQESVESSVPEETQEPEEDEEDTAIHRYELIVEDVTWLGAWQACRQRGGYLVHINSEEEYNAIMDQILREDKRKIIFWLGASRAGDSHDYHWVNEDGSYGKEIINNNPVYDDFWLEGEPSYESEGEPELYLNMFYRSDEDRMVWNDAPGDLIAVVSSYEGMIGYICEYED